MTIPDSAKVDGKAVVPSEVNDSVSLHRLLLLCQGYRRCSVDILGMDERWKSSGQDYGWDAV